VLTLSVSIVACLCGEERHEDWAERIEGGRGQGGGWWEGGETRLESWLGEEKYLVRCWNQ